VTKKQGRVLDDENYYEAYWSEERLPLISHESGYGNFSSALEHLFQTFTKPEDRCLDLGCGNGVTSGHWLTRNGRKYLGADVSETAVATARASGLNVCTISDASILPFKDEEFDTVVCVEVLEHLFLPHKAAQEIFRVLKSGGRLIATVPNAAHIGRRVELGVRGVFNPMGDALSIDQPWRDPHIRFFTAQTLAKMLRSVGFRNVSIGGHEGLIQRLPASWTRTRRADQGRRTRLDERLHSLATSILAVRLNAVARK